MEAENVAAADVIETLRAESDDLEGEIADLSDQVEERDALVDEIDDRESDLDEREESLDDQESALDEREQEISDAEEEIEANTIPGNGIWLVGDEVDPGVYKAEGSGSSCYWARLNSLDTSDIIDNHFGSASVSVEIHSGDAAFETSGCGSWLKR